MIDIDRVRPWPFNGGRNDNVIVAVFENAIKAFDVGVNQPEQAISPGQAGRPNAA